MRIDVITLFPDLVRVPMSLSMMGRAQQQGTLDLRVHDLREHGLGKHRQVDDTPTGGGPGMVLRPEPIVAALEKLPPRGHVILTSPAGKRFDQATAQRLSQLPHLVFISGHYEGIDHRVVDHWVHEELSLGDYVLTNGAIASVVMIDAVVRLLPGVLGDELSAIEESFGHTGLLEAPQYTKPASFRDLPIPEILLSGNHALIAQWRAEQSLARTRNNRPDLLPDP